jgi:hypothetical protein
MAKASGKKAFFFEKKKQKTSVCFGFGLSGIGSAPTRKSFLVLFFKKEPLLGHSPLHKPHPRPHVKNNGPLA